MAERPKYFDGQEMRLGDRVRLGEDDGGVGGDVSYAVLLLWRKCLFSNFVDETTKACLVEANYQI